VGGGAGSDRELARRVGLLLQAVRVKAGWSQGRLALEAGTSQQWISRVEQGRTDLRLGRVEKLFAVLGTRVTAETEIRLDPALRDLLTEDEAAAELSTLVLLTGIIWKRLAGIPHAMAGRFSALAQGLPVRPARIDLLVPEEHVDRVSAAFDTLNMPRWDSVMQEYGWHNADLRHPAPLRWFAGGLIPMRATIVPKLPPVLKVTVDDRELSLVPHTTLLASDPDVADLRRRSASAPAG
jgi:transcriptional regulator with XRE-family HTH domain